MQYIEPWDGVESQSSSSSDFSSPSSYQRPLLVPSLNLHPRARVRQRSDSGRGRASANDANDANPRAPAPITRIRRASRLDLPTELNSKQKGCVAATPPSGMAPSCGWRSLEDTAVRLLFCIIYVSPVLHPSLLLALPLAFIQTLGSPPQIPLSLFPLTLDSRTLSHTLLSHTHSTPTSSNHHPVSLLLILFYSSASNKL